MFHDQSPWKNLADLGGGWTRNLLVSSWTAHPTEPTKPARKRMTVQNISWSISMKECCWTWRGWWIAVLRPFQHFLDDIAMMERVIMKGSVQWKAVLSWAAFCLQLDSNPGPCDLKYGAVPTRLLSQRGSNPRPPDHQLAVHLTELSIKTSITSGWWHVCPRAKCFNNKWNPFSLQSPILNSN